MRRSSRRARNPSEAAIALLVDTHVLIWMGYGSPALPEHVRTRLADDVVYVSELSRVEIVVKERSIGRLFGIDFDLLIGRAGFIPITLPVGVHRVLERLPKVHRDPFDRLLIAQAIHADLALVTSDAKASQYPVRIFW